MQSTVDGALSALRMTVHNYETSLNALVRGIVVADATARDSVMQFVSEVIVKNERRAQMQVDRMQVASAGFMTNLVAVCLRLCEPFLQKNVWEEKLKVVEPDYPLRSSRFHITKETRLRAQSDEIEAWQKANMTEEGRKSQIWSPFLPLQNLHDLGPPFCVVFCFFV